MLNEFGHDVCSPDGGGAAETKNWGCACGAAMMGDVVGLVMVKICYYSGQWKFRCLAYCKAHCAVVWVAAHYFDDCTLDTSVTR